VTLIQRSFQRQIITSCPGSCRHGLLAFHLVDCQQRREGGAAG
jgi:hypothetical protein